MNRAERAATRPSFVYRCYDARDRLLYVGSTFDVAQRSLGHQSQSAWWMFVARTESEEFADRPTAEAAERRAITTERPAYNLYGRSVHRNEWTAQDYADVITALGWKQQTEQTRRRIARLTAERDMRFVEVPA